MSLVPSLRASGPCSAAASCGPPARPFTSSYPELPREVPKTVCEALRATPASGNVDSPAEDPCGALVEEPDLPAQKVSEVTYLRSVEVRATWVQQPSWRVL